MLRDDDWIVHLDEETLLTTNAVSGILNFCEEGKHDFGQGVITYAHGDIVNWITTLSDSFRYYFFLIQGKTIFSVLLMTWESFVFNFPFFINQFLVGKDRLL